MKLLSFLSLAFIAIAQSQAGLVSVNLGGNSETAGWGAPGTALTSSNYTGTQLAAGVAATYGSAASTSTLVRLNGSFFPAGFGLYSFGTDSDFSARNSVTTLSSVNTIVFQTETARNPGGYPSDDPEHVVDPVYAFSYPTLYVNGGTTGITPDFSYFGLSGDSVAFGEDQIALYNWMWQWDVSDLGPITSYTVEWKQIVHASLVSIRLDASDAVNNGSVLPVPEPASAGLMAFGFAGLLIRRRR